MRAPGGLRGAWPLRGRETQWQRKPCHNGRRPIPAMIRGFRERSQDRAHHGRPRCVRCRLRCPYIGCAEDDRLRHPAHVRHVRRHHLGADAYRALGFGHVAVRGLGHAAVPFPCEGESAGVPRIVVCVHCGVRGHRAQRGSAPSTLCLPGRGLRGAFVLGGVGAVQGVRSDSASCGSFRRWSRAPSSSASGLFWQARPLPTATTNWPIALVAIIIIVISNIWGTRHDHASSPSFWVLWAPIVAAAIGGIVDFTPVVEAPWIGLPVLWDNTVFALFGPSFDAGLAITAIITIMPLGLRHHHRAHRRHVGHQLYLQSQFHRRAGAAPHAARRRPGHYRGVAVRRAG